MDTQLKGGARLCLLNMALSTALRFCLVARRSLGIIPHQPARSIRWNRRTTSRASSAYSKQEGNALFDILERNKDTEIGKRWNFKDITTIYGYCEQVPLTTFGVYQEYIDRIVNRGEQNLLTADEVVAFAPSSGTTGLMKLVPITQAAIDKFDDADTTLRNLLLSSFFIKESDTLSGKPIQSISRLSESIRELCRGILIATLCRAKLMAFAIVCFSIICSVSVWVEGYIS